MATSGASMSTAGEMREEPDAVSRRRLYWYLLPLVAGPLLLLAMAFVILPSKWFARRAQSSYLANLGYADSLRNADCSILIYGDSTAMVGLDPAILRAQTGLSTCNIAEFQGMTMVNDTMLLDGYLSRNRRPRFLVFVFTPEDLDPQSQTNVGSFEAITWRMRQPHKLAGVTDLAMHHLLDLFTWAEQGMRFALVHLRSKPYTEEMMHLRDARDGQFPISAPTLTECDGLRRDAPPDTRWIVGLRSKYGVEGTTVLVDATPTTPCDPSLTFFREHLRGVIDNDVETMPLSAYTTDGRLHVNRSGSELMSQQLARQILEASAGVR